MTLILPNILKPAFWLSIWSVVENIPSVIVKEVYSAVNGYVILSVITYIELFDSLQCSSLNILKFGVSGCSSNYLEWGIKISNYS
jgi:hypothetical protein